MWDGEQRPGRYGGGVGTPTPERAALVQLLRSRPHGLSWIQLTAEVRERGSALEALEALSPDELLPSPQRLADQETALNDVLAWEKAGLDFVSIVDDRYPAAIRDIHQAPPFLFIRGTTLPDDVAVSVVGSREASQQGLHMATVVAQALVEMRVSVVSAWPRESMGRHTAPPSRRVERPVRVIANRNREAVPRSASRLHARVAGSGLLVSQFWPDAPPQKHNFLMRNATMSGYGVATVVIEAGERSGARAQARMAVEHGRPVILTDLVVAKTQWGAAMVDRPGVHVATSVHEVTEAVQAIIATPSRSRTRSQLWLPDRCPLKLTLHRSERRGRS